ncbi:MAG: ABC transporter ATP-binding protein [Gammaproteobacteria bacterium]|nr:ABC transporter ATP-binding protein [Gammaproteobacteria bacterium]
MPADSHAAIVSDVFEAGSPSAEFEALRLDFKGLARVYLSTWPYIYEQLRHFLALLFLNLALVGFGTAIGFLSFDILWDSVGQREPLSGMQAFVLQLPPAAYVDAAALSDAAAFEILFRFLIVSAVIIILTTTMVTGIAMYKVWILQRVNQELRVALVQNAEELSLRFHTKMTAGDGIYRVFQDSAMVTAVVDNIVVQPIISIAVLVMQIVIATLFSPWFAFLLLVAVLTIVLITSWFTPRLRRWSQTARRANAELFTRVQETFQSIQAIKAYRFEDANHAQFSAVSQRALDSAFQLRGEFALLKVVVSFLLVLTLFVTDYVATQYVLENQTVFGASLLVLFGMSLTNWTVAAHQARRGALGAFILNFEILVKVWCYAQDMAVGLGRAFWLLEQKPEVQDPDEPQPFPRVADGVRFERVDFGYEADVPVLAGFNLTARIGEITALVGESGAGKSTAMTLLLRLFDPDEGKVLIDDVDIRTVRVHDLREHVAITLQENVLFPVSVADNVRYATPDASDAELQQALELTCADEFVDALPEGLQTELGVDGALLSVGQKQRISIARAVLRNTRILVLDEPTASLDPATERQVIANLKRWAADRVTILITHRLSTIRNADQIAFLSDGKIVESGTHESLLEEGGHYFNFVSRHETDNV